MECDLRQTPRQFIRVPNMEYIYLSYRTDEGFICCEREVQILKGLMDLERSYGVPEKI